MTKIDWCTRVWNPVTGCSKVSEGCKNCYAESIARRFWKGRSFGDVQCHESRLDIPLHWKKPQIVFVNSMSDLFHEKVPDSFIAEVFSYMASWRKVCTKKDCEHDDPDCIVDPGHTFIILTKRPERMKEFITEKLPWIAGDYYPGDDALPIAYEIHEGGLENVFPNVWLGVSVENQARADERIPLLLQTPAAKRIVSVEPMLEEMDLSKYVWMEDSRDCGQDRDGLDWVICGRETGAGARPFDAKWAMDLKGQCDAAGVPFWWKNHPEFQERPQ